jgi:hypothetical protein
MAKRLLDRQVSLIEHLTSAAAIFGDRTGPGLDRSLHGIDPGLLRIEARFSHEKRMEKIAAVFPRTIGLLGDERDSIIRGFAAACPPMDISRIENATQFHEFLLSRWRHEPPAPRYLPDVAGCELACAKVRVAADQPVPTAAAPDAPNMAIRRRPDIALLRTTYDVRSVFEGEAEHIVPIQRDTPLAVALDPESDQPQILELAPEVFDLLAALDDWTNPAMHNGSPEVTELIAGLVEAALVEIRR